MSSPEFEGVTPNEAHGARNLSEQEIGQLLVREIIEETFGSQSAETTEALAA